MRLKRLFVSFLLLSLLGGGMIFADTVVNKIKLTVNGAELSDSAIVADGTTYVPLRQVSDLLGAFVTWDNKQVNINKPNVHMMTLKGSTPFQVVPKGAKETFIVAAQVDSLKTPISAVKIVMLDPSDAELEIYYNDVSVDRDTSAAFNLISPETTYRFNKEGEYKVRIYMKAAKSSDWTLVAEKLISCK